MLQSCPRENAGQITQHAVELKNAAGDCDEVNALDVGRPVGARIVGEFLIGLIDLDPTSVCHAPVDWRPASSLTLRQVILVGL